MKSRLAISFPLLVLLLGACGSVSDEEIEKAGKTYPPAVLEEIVSGCETQCLKKRDAAKCNSVCSCKGRIVARQLPYKSYLKLKKKGRLELNGTINRMTVGCARH